MDGVKEEETLISVIVPCYNVEQYVRRCIESILAQSYLNIEVLAIDDGSTDATGKILDELAKKDTRVRTYHFENGGLSVARNRGLDRMQGRYVTCVDGDDFIDRDMIKSMFQKIKETRADLVACNHYLYYGKDINKFGNPQIKDIDHMSSQDAIHKLFDGDSRFVTAWAKLYNIGLWNDLRYPEDVRFGEDMFLAHILFDRADSISYVGMPLYYYNQEGTSLVRSKFNRNKLEMVTACERWIAFCNERYPDIREEAKRYYLLTIINMCSHLITPELEDDYEKYRRAIRANFRWILFSDLNVREKIKSFLIIRLHNKEYGKIRDTVISILDKNKKVCRGDWRYSDERK